MSALVHLANDNAELTAELAQARAAGIVIPHTAQLIYETYALPALAQILQDPQATKSEKFQAMRELAKVGDIDPKQAAVGAGGPGGFQLNITIPPGGQVHGTNDPRVIQTAPITLTLSEPELPSKPEGYQAPPFALTKDLIGPPLETLT